MSQGFYTAISGITASQQKIDVISDNIANINTVAFKESQINFSDVFAKTISLGSAPSKNLGGTNPLQVGLGTKVANISKNFAGGTPQSTGVISDLYLDGPGFFCVQGANNEILLTRAGNFTVDTQGYLTTANGNRVLGTSTSYSINGSNVPIKIPPMLTLGTQGTADNVKLTTADLDELNGLSFEKSTDAAATDMIFRVKRADGTSQAVSVNISAANNLQQVMTACNTALTGVLGAGVVTMSATAPADGTISMVIDKAQSAVGPLSPITSITIDSEESDFGEETELGKVAGTNSAPATPAVGTITYKSKILDYEASVGPADNVLQASKLISYYIDGDGAIQAAYANGDKLSVRTDPDTKQISLVYITQNGNVEIESEDVTVKANIIGPANLQLQLGSVVNDKGLVSCGNNNYKAGPNSGEIMYSCANNNGFAKITSGALESSNVDMTRQFAELIVAQRSIEANSRTFDTVSRVLQNLIQMGR